MAIKRLGILVGGGPAPGTNGVISAVVIEAIKMGCTPVGFHDGFEWLSQRYTDEQHEMTIDEVSRIHLDGGSILGTARTDITRDQESTDNTVAAFRKLGIEALVTVGGDDLVRSSAAVERAAGGSIRVVQVPKSIDNDLLLPLSVAMLRQAALQTANARRGFVLPPGLAKRLDSTQVLTSARPLA